MSDLLCVGVCMIDWEAGVCLGCGRTSAEIEGNVGEGSASLPAAVSDETGLPDADQQKGGREDD